MGSLILNLFGISDTNAKVDIYNLRIDSFRDYNLKFLESKSLNSLNPKDLDSNSSNFSFNPLDSKVSCSTKNYSSKNTLSFL